MQPHSFPLPVCLPDDQVIDNTRLSAALGNPSRQLIHAWRKRKDFPCSYKNGNTVFFLTDEVESWLLACNIPVKRIIHNDR